MTKIQFLLKKKRKLICNSSILEQRNYRWKTTWRKQSSSPTSWGYTSVRISLGTERGLRASCLILNCSLTVLDSHSSFFFSIKQIFLYWAAQSMESTYLQSWRCPEAALWQLVWSLYVDSQTGQPPAELVGNPEFWFGVKNMQTNKMTRGGMRISNTGSSFKLKITEQCTVSVPLCEIKMIWDQGIKLDAAATSSLLQGQVNKPLFLKCLGVQLLYRPSVTLLY